MSKINILIKSENETLTTVDCFKIILLLIKMASSWRNSSILFHVQNVSLHILSNLTAQVKWMNTNVIIHYPCTTCRNSIQSLKLSKIISYTSNALQSVKLKENNKHSMKNLMVDWVCTRDGRSSGFFKFKLNRRKDFFINLLQITKLCNFYSNPFGLFQTIVI